MTSDLRITAAEFIDIAECVLADLDDNVSDTIPKTKTDAAIDQISTTLQREIRRLALACAHTRQEKENKEIKKNKKRKKERKEKTNNTCKYIELLPRHLQDSTQFRTKWYEWEEHRAEVGHKLTKRAVENQASILTQFSAGDAIDTITNSIAGSYRGLFPTKKTQDKYRHKTDTQTRALHASVEDLEMATLLCDAINTATNNMSTHTAADMLDAVDTIKQFYGRIAFDRCKSLKQHINSCKKLVREYSKHIKEKLNGYMSLGPQHLSADKTIFKQFIRAYEHSIAITLTTGRTLS